MRPLRAFPTAVVILVGCILEVSPSTPCTYHDPVTTDCATSLLRISSQKHALAPPSAPSTLLRLERLSAWRTRIELRGGETRASRSRVQGGGGGREERPVKETRSRRSRRRVEDDEEQERAGDERTRDARAFEYDDDEGSSHENPQGEREDEEEDVTDMQRFFPKLRRLGINITHRGEFTDSVAEQLLKETWKQVQAKLDDASNEELLQFAREARDEGIIEELIQNKTLPPSLYGALDERLDEVLDTATDAHCYSPLAVHSLFDLRLPGKDRKRHERLVAEALSRSQRGGREGGEREGGGGGEEEDGGHVLHHPGTCASLPEAAEVAQSAGLTLLLPAGHEAAFAPARLLVFPRAQLRLQAPPRNVILGGQLELCEKSQGHVSGPNITWAADDPHDETVLVRGGSWAFRECDVRCSKGTAVRVINGWSELADPKNLGGVPEREWLLGGGGEGGDVRGELEMDECGVGGRDVTRWSRVTHLELQGQQARCGVDVQDESSVKLVRCSVHDTEVCAASVSGTASLSLQRCHVAYSLAGIACLESSFASISDSRIEFCWLGAGVRGEGRSTIEVVGCDVANCAFALSTQQDCTISLASSALLNSSYASFAQLGSPDPSQNNCSLSLADNVVFLAPDTPLWFGTARPLRCTGQDESGLRVVQPSVPLATPDQVAFARDLEEKLGVPSERDLEPLRRDLAEFYQSGEVTRMMQQNLELSEREASAERDDSDLTLPE